MILTKYCEKCETETRWHAKANRCKQCSSQAAEASNAKRLAEKVGKYRETRKVGAATSRDYNKMTAPVYTGEKWLNARGQMTPTFAYISASYGVSSQ